LKIYLYFFGNTYYIKSKSRFEGALLEREKGSKEMTIEYRNNLSLYRGQCGMVKSFPPDGGQMLCFRHSVLTRMQGFFCLKFEREEKNE